jgi:hypothetical protein
MKLQAQHLQPGMVIGSGETVIGTFITCRTPSGKVNVTLQNKAGKRRIVMWGKYTMIAVSYHMTAAEYTNMLVPEVANPYNNVG